VRVAAQAHAPPKFALSMNSSDDHAPPGKLRDDGAKSIHANCVRARHVSTQSCECDRTRWSCLIADSNDRSRCCASSSRCVLNVSQHEHV
jgi:hypothetical protein